MNFNTKREALRWGLHWRRIRILLLADTLIAALLTMFSSLADPTESLYRHLVANVLFSHAIGTTVYLLALATGVLTIETWWKRMPAFTGVFILGGCIGAPMGWILTNFVLDLDQPVVNPLMFFAWNTLLAIIFGTAVMGYFGLRKRLEEAILRLTEKELNEQRLLGLKTKAELEALRAKINPHFLFNTLNSIASLIPVDPARAEGMVQKLAHLFRYALDASSRETMALTEELRVVSEYLEIEKIRLGERLSYEVEMDASLDGVSIPGLILQPLVENSVKHGIAPRKAGGSIRVRCRREGEWCRIDIVDDGEGFREAGIVEGFGIGGVRERLGLHYGPAHEFSITSDQGVRILLRLPIRGMGPDPLFRATRAIQNSVNR